MGRRRGIRYFFNDSFLSRVLFGLMMYLPMGACGLLNFNFSPALLSSSLTALLLHTPISVRFLFCPRCFPVVMSVEGPSCDRDGGNNVLPCLMTRWAHELLRKLSVSVLCLPYICIPGLRCSLIHSTPTPTRPLPVPFSRDPDHRPGPSV